MRRFQGIRLNDTFLRGSGRESRRAASRIRFLRAAMSLLFLLCGAAGVQAQFQITSATYGTPPATTVPAGSNGVTLQLTGTLPSAQQQSAVLGCFYTGFGSTAGFAVPLPNGTNTEPLVVPASTIQSIPQTSFTASNNYSVTALVYYIPATGTCDGTASGAISNQYPMQVVAPSLGAYSGPTNVPQTNAATNLQAPPLALSLPAAGFLTGTASGGTTTISFGSFGSVNVTPGTSSLYVPVPAAFSSSPVGTTASLSICNTLTGNATPVCTTPTPAITLTVTALVASTGTIAANPNPVLTSGQAVLTAQFSKAAGTSGTAAPGAPSGPVTFVANGNTLPAAALVLDKTATFATQTTTVTPPTAPTPTITPAAGNYLGAQTITIADSAANAAIYFTQDGSTPTTGSTLYSGPFSISTSQTVSAIAAVPGFLNSAVASAGYQITLRPATQLAFQVQPSNSFLDTAIAPPVQVAIEDSTGAVVTSSTAAVSLILDRNPGDTVLLGTTTVNAVNGVATFSNLSIGQLGTGYTIQATSGNLTPAVSNQFNITPPTITLAVQSELIGINSTLNGTITLGAPAPAGGEVVQLSSSRPANVTVAPASVTIAAGQTTGAFTYTGVAAGNSTITATAAGYQNGTVMTTGTAAQVSLGMIPNVAPAQMQSIALSLATPAPAGGTTVTFTIANPNIATVTATSFVPAGSQTPAANPQVTGVLIGTTTVTANAPGYAPATRPVVVTVTAGFNPGTTNINLATTTTTSLAISAPAPPGGIAFTLSSDSPAIATISSSVTIPAGATSVPITITGVSAGSTTIRADSPGITEATGTVNVDSDIGMSTLTTGYDLEEDTNLYLPVAPLAPTTVTVTSSDPATVVISTSDSVAGQATLTFPNTTSYYIGAIAVQGLKVGTATLSITAPGYNAGSIVVTVDPSGFVINNYQLAFTTTTYSGTSTLTAYPAILNPDLSYNVTSQLIPQAPTISLPVTSSDTTVGTVTNSPLVFQPTNTSQNITFQPAAVGTTNIDLGAPPAGFSVSTSYQQSVATVVTPAISLNAFTTGVQLQGYMYISLPEPPPSPVTVTLTSSDPTKVTLSASDTAVGTGTLTVTVPAGQYGVGYIWFQGQAVGTSTLTVAAPGYTSATSTITVDPSGFEYYYTGSFQTTTFSGPTQLNLTTAILDPTNSTVVTNGYYFNPGVAPVTVPLSNSASNVGTITNGGATFAAGTGYASTTFQPLAAGTANIAITTPSGFTAVSPAQTLTATVTAPAIQVGPATTGVNLKTSGGIYLPVAPPSGHPVNVTVTSSSPAIATLSTSATTVGTASVTFTNVTGTYVGTVYVQGQGVGSATITESAADASTGAQDYTSGTNTLTVEPSGFTFFYGRPPFTTTTFSGPSTIPVYTTTLVNGGYVDQIGLAINPGVAPATVVVSDSAPSVGTVSAAALVFNPGDGQHSFTFQPVSAGDTIVAISTPAGFTTGQYAYLSGDITVTAPTIQIDSITTGVNLDGSMGIYLPQTPPNPVNVTVTSSSPMLATLSTDPTVVGTQTVTFTNVTSTNVGTIYVQGQSLGTAQLTETAPGYINGGSTITVYPSGFVFDGNPNFDLNAPGGAPSTQNVYTAVLTPGTLTVYEGLFNLGINPGLGNIGVPVVSSDPSVASVVTSPLVFGPGVGSATVSIQPVAAGTATITVGVPTTPANFSTPSQYTQATVTVP